MSETQTGREPIQIIEIDQDFCDNTYGSAPCTAAIGVTGTDRCFNTRKTCQDPANYADSPLTLRFAKPASNLPADEYLIPSLVSVKTSPTEINAGGGGRNSKPLGVRATMTATLTDHPHNDRVVDKYRTQRSYIASDRSTFWAKWMARNPFYQNRTVRVLDGYVGQSLASMTTRTYLIESIAGPDSNGKVTIKAKDVLTLADNDKTTAPAASTGELIVDTGAAITTIRVTGAPVADYPAPGTVRINDELITYAGASTISPTEINLTGCVRSTNGTEADDHDAEDRVQWCLEYTNQNCVDITSDLLTTYGNIDASYIPTTDWNDERDTWLAQFNVSTIISEPVGVSDLLAELTEQCIFYIWWDERAQEIKLRAIRPATETPIVIDDESSIIENSAAITESAKERLSQVWVFFQQRDPTASLSEEKNYSRLRIRADLEKEGPDQYGEQRIKKIYSRWLGTDALAINLGARLLARYINNPQYMTVTLDAKDRALWTGDLCDVTHRNLVDEFGEQIITRFQVISADEIDSGHRVKYKLLKFELVGRFAYWMRDDAPVFTLASEADLEQGMWWSDTLGKMSDGSDGYTWQ